MTKFLKISAAAIALIASVPTTSSAAGTLPVTGPIMQSLSVGGVANPRLGVGAPITYAVSTNGWTTVRLKVLDAGGSLVRLIESRGTAGGTFTTSWDGKTASGAPAGNGLYTLVADPAGYVYDRTIGEAGTGIGELTLPLGVDEAPDGTVWVADNGRVVHYAADGTYLSSFVPATIGRPYGIRFDARGNFWVTNGGAVAVRYDGAGVENGRITLPAGSGIYDISQLSNGDYIASRWVPNYWTFQRFSPNVVDYGVYGCCYNEQRSVVESPGGYLLTACGGCQNIYSYYLNGSFTGWAPGNMCFGGSCPGLGYTYGQIDTGESGGALFAMYNRHQIGEYAGEFTNTALWATGYNGTNHGQFQYPWGIARAGDHLYVADQSNHRVEVYKRSAPMTTTIRVDSTGPSVSDFEVTASEEGGAILSAIADDSATGGSAIGGAEVFFDVSGPDGSGQGFSASDGVLDSATERVFTFVAPRNGVTRAYVHAKDAAGNWGGFRSIDLRVFGLPATMEATAARATVGPGGADSGQRITAAVRDSVGNGLDGRAIVLRACPQLLAAPPEGSALCATTTTTTANGAAVWEVPPYAMLLPGEYTVTATSGSLSATTTFVVVG